MSVRPAGVNVAGSKPLPSLGRLLSEHRAPRALKVIVGLSGPLLLVMGVGAFAGALDHDPREPVAVRVSLAVIGFCFGGLGAALLVILRRKAATLVQLYEGGMVELVGAKRREVAWRDVLSFRQTDYAQGLYRLSELKLELRDGTRLRFNSQHLQGLSAIVARLEREITSEALPRLRQGLQSGQTLSFGTLALSQQGVHHRKRIIPWSEVANAQVRLGYLELLRHGDAAPALRIRVARLERVEALLTLTRELRQCPALSPPFAASSAFRQVCNRLWLLTLVAGAPMALFLGFGGYSLYRALEALDATGHPQAKSPAQYFVWAVLLATLALLLGLGWWHDISVHVRRHRLARRLGAAGKLVPVLVLERVYEEWSFHPGWRFRYLTPAGFEGTDTVEAASGDAEAWTSGSKQLLALCSLDERESVLLSASGYPLARLPATPDNS